MSERKAEIIDEARKLMAHPRPNADVLIALLCAWDMGYRSPAALAEMACKMVPAPVGTLSVDK